MGKEEKSKKPGEAQNQDQRYFPASHVEISWWRSTCWVKVLVDDTSRFSVCWKRVRVRNFFFYLGRGFLKFTIGCGLCLAGSPPGFSRRCGWWWWWWLYKRKKREHDVDAARRWYAMSVRLVLKMERALASSAAGHSLVHVARATPAGGSRGAATLTSSPQADP